MPKSQTWVVYVEIYTDPAHKNLSGVYVEGTYTGNDAGGRAACEFCYEKIKHAAERTGGTVKTHGGYSYGDREYRAWYDRPNASCETDLHPVYVAKRVTHRIKSAAGKLPRGA